MKGKKRIAIWALCAVLAVTAGGAVVYAVRSSRCCGPIQVQEPQTTIAAEQTGVLSAFTAKDLEGADVSQSVFQGKQLTMVNFWATFCGPCIREMPELAELHREYADKGVQIIGIPVDVTDRKANVSQSVLSTARAIVDQTGADYMHIIPSQSLITAKVGAVSSVPETIFVDENGNQVGKAYIGARSKAAWAAIIDDLLEGMAG